MKIQEIQLEHLLPLFMRQDKSNLALAKVASDALQVFANEIAKLSTFDALDKLSAAELDELADELNIFWYDKTFTDEQKRALILNSDKVFMKLGTKSAVEQVVKDIFGVAGVEEFFDYGGNPHYFRIRVFNVSVLSAENEAKLLRMLEYVKRKSQWLEEIYCEIASKMPLNVGFHLTFEKRETPRIDTWQDNADINANAGAGVYSRTK